MNTALLIIDMQQALCTGPEAAFEIDRVLQTINTLGTMARAAGVPVIIIQHEEAAGMLQLGSEGWQLADGLVTSPDDFRIRKTTPDSFLRTELQQHLQERDITHLIICGLQTDCCINTTVCRALALGFDVTLASDAHSTFAYGALTAAQVIAHFNFLLRGMTSYGPTIRVSRGDAVRFGSRAA